MERCGFGVRHNDARELRFDPQHHGPNPAYIHDAGNPPKEASGTPVSPTTPRGHRARVTGLDDIFDGGLPSAVPIDDGKNAGRSRRVPRWLGWSAVIGCVVACLTAPFLVPPALVARQAAYGWQDLPTSLPLAAELPQRTELIDRNGKTFAILFGQNRTPVKLNQVAQPAIDALLATEDDRFYQHGAFDPVGLARAVVHNRSGGSRQGGSGITQQYVKNLLLSQATTQDEADAVTQATLGRKLRELKYAVALESTISKDEILERYLNTVNFGDGAWGIGAAALHYFDVPASKLTIAQAATIIGILKSPTNYNPVDNPERSQIRRDVVLDRMLAAGRISQKQHDSASAAPIRLKVTDPPHGCGASTFPFYCQWIIDQISHDPGFGATPEARQELLFRGGLKVHTALDPAAMEIATKAAQRALNSKNRVATGIAIVEPGTGEVRALATNRTWGRNAAKGQTQIVLPTRHAFQPGSNFKPITLATAVEQGFSLSTTFDTPDGYIPENMNYPPGGFHNDNNRNNGVLNATQATARSVNTWYIQLEERYGVLSVADMAARLGITSLPRTGSRKITSRDASLTLGAYEVSPLEMAAAYATLASGGIACTPVGVMSMTDRSGKPLHVPSAQCHRAISAYVADSVSQVLRAVFAPYGTGVGLDLAGRPIAGKTGTTNDSAATWFTGFTPQYAMSVWVGDPRGGQKYPLRNIEAYGQQIGTVYGRSVAGPIWQETMRGLHEQLPVKQFESPSASAMSGLVPPVPDVRGMSRDAAVTALLDAGFRVRLQPKTAAPDSNLPPGQVVAQSPSSGDLAEYNSLVTLTLTDGSDVVATIPAPWQLPRDVAP